MFVFNRDFRYVYVCGRTSSYMRMINSSLLENDGIGGT